MKEKYTVKDIVKMAKDEFEIDTYDYSVAKVIDRNLERNIQRYTQKNMTPISTHGRTKYYSFKQVENIFYGTNSLHKYFVSQSKVSAAKQSKAILKSKEEYEKQINADLTKTTIEFDRTLEKLELDLADYFILMDDAVTTKEYLTIEELDLLNKKGFFPRNLLNNEELEILSHTQSIKTFQEQQNKAIQEMFSQKKMEMMITALFNQKFELDEELLLDDVRKTCEADVLGIPEPNMLLSMNRLKHFKYYCKPITTEPDVDLDE